MEMETLKSMFEMHIRECDGRDARNEKARDEVRNMFKGIWDTLDTDRAGAKLDREEDQKDREAIKDDLKKLELRAAFFFGGIIALSKVFDYMFMLHK